MCISEAKEGAQNSVLFTNLSRQINSKMFQRKAPLQNRIFEDGRLSIQQNFQQNCLAQFGKLGVI